MAYGLKYFCVQKTKFPQAKTTEIRILEDGFSGTPTEVRGMDEVYKHSYDRIDPREPFKEPLQESILEFSLAVQGSSEESIIAEIFAADEDQFRIQKVDSPGTADEKVVWTGSVIPDMLERSEAPYPNAARITAKDTTRLEGSDYPLRSATDRRTIITVIVDILSNLGYSLPIVSYTSWTNSKINSADDFLNQIYIDTYNLRTFASNGDEPDEAISNKEALEAILKNYGLILHQSDGAWRLFQVTALDDPTTVQTFEYDSTGTQTASSSSDLTVSIDRIARYVLGSSTVNARRPIKEARVKYKHRSEVSKLKFPESVKIQQGGTDETFTQGFFKSNGNQSIKLTGRIYGEESVASPDVTRTATVKVEIKVVGADTYYWDGSQWLKNTFAELSLDAVTTIIGPPTQWYETPLNVETTDLPSGADGSLEIVLKPMKVDATNADCDPTRYERLSFEIVNPTIETGNNTSIDYFLQQSGNYSPKYEHPDVWFGDGPTDYARSAISVNSSGDTLTNDDWLRRGETSVQNNFIRLLLREILDTQRTTLYGLEGELAGDYSPYQVVQYDGKNYFFIGGEQSGKDASWSADFMDITIQTASDTFSRIYRTSDDETTDSGTGGGGATTPYWGDIINKPVGESEWETETGFDNRYLKQSNNLSDLNDASAARTNLSVYSQSQLYTKSQSDDRYLNESSNLSDIPDVAAARSNLSVYPKSSLYTRTESDDRYLNEAKNLSDLPNLATARSNLNVYPTTKLYTRTESDDRYLNESSNLSDLADKAASRINLGVEIGADVQAWSARLDELAAFSATQIQYLNSINQYLSKNSIPTFRGINWADGATSIDAKLGSGGSAYQYTMEWDQTTGDTELTEPGDYAVTIEWDEGTTATAAPEYTETPTYDLLWHNTAGQPILGLNEDRSARFYKDLTVNNYLRAGLARIEGVTTLGDTIRKDDFQLTTEFSGRGWRGSSEGDFNIRNLVVREAAKFRELIIDQLGVIAGSDIRSVARGKIKSVYERENSIKLENPNGRNATTFTDQGDTNGGDFFWVKAVDVDHSSFVDLKGQVTDIAIEDGEITLTLDTTVTGGTHEQEGVTDISALREGDVIMQRGHPTDSTRQNLIYTTVSDSDAPVQRYLTGIDSLPKFDEVAQITTQMGMTNSLASTYSAISSGEHALFTANAYLTNKILVGDLSKTGNYLEYANGKMHLSGDANITGLLTASQVKVGTLSTGAPYEVHGLELNSDNYWKYLKGSPYSNPNYVTLRVGNSTNYFRWNVGNDGKLEWKGENTSLINGLFTATNADIKGTIEATSLNISGSGIINDTLTVGDTSGAKLLMDSSNKSLSLHKSINSTFYKTLNIQNNNTFSTVGQVLSSNLRNANPLQYGSSYNGSVTVYETITLDSTLGYSLTARISGQTQQSTPPSYVDIGFKVEIYNSNTASFEVVGGTPYHLTTNELEDTNVVVLDEYRLTDFTDTEYDIFLLHLGNKGSEYTEIRLTLYDAGHSGDLDTQVNTYVGGGLYRETNTAKTEITHKGFISGLSANAFVEMSREHFKSKGRNLIIERGGLNIVDSVIRLKNGWASTGTRISGNAWFLHDVTIDGNLSKSTGSFRIPHPDPRKNGRYELWHSFVESPTAGENLYTYRVVSTKQDEVVSVDIQDYWHHLNENPRIWVQPIGQYAKAYGWIEGDKIKVKCSKPGSYDVLLLGTRKDPKALEAWKGDERKVS